MQREISLFDNTGFERQKQSFVRFLDCAIGIIVCAYNIQISRQLEWRENKKKFFQLHLKFLIRNLGFCKFVENSLPRAFCFTFFFFFTRYNFTSSLIQSDSYVSSIRLLAFFSSLVFSKGVKMWNARE